MRGRKPKKVAIITPYVLPAHLDFYNLLGKKDLFEFHIFMTKMKAKHRVHDDHSNKFLFNYTVMKSLSLYYQRKEISFDFAVGWNKYLSNFKPDIIIFDGYGLSFIGAWIYTKVHSIPSIFWNSNSSVMSIQYDSWATKMLKRLILKLNDEWMAGGAMMVKYLEKYGIPKEKITIVPFCINTIAFSKNVFKYADSIKYREKKRILYIGELTHRKGVDVLIKAFSQIQDNETILQIVGAGPKEKELKKLCKDINISNKVNFLGYYERKRLSKVFANADIMAVPSRREPFGLVVNEGGAAGLWMIVSSQVGAAYDLVHTNFNGIIFQSENVEELQKCISNALENIEKIRLKRREMANKICEDWNIDIAAEKLEEAVNKLL